MYKLLEKTVKPHLENFVEDLIVHDKAKLKGYKGIYIYAYRSLGTNIILLDDNLFDYSLNEETLKKSTSNMIEFFKGANINFLYFDGEKLIPKKWEEIQTIYNLFINGVMRKKVELEKLNINLLAIELLTLMRNTRNWKKVISDSDLDVFRRMRNRFDYMKIKKSDSLELIKEQLYTQCLLLK